MGFRPNGLACGGRPAGTAWQKKLFDRVAALYGLAFFSPALIGIGVAIRLTEGGPVLFAHERIGRGGRRFRCLKFRTMAVNVNELLADLPARDPQSLAEWQAQRKLTNDPRISRDELPQFWNVLAGEMSPVGPRPVVAEELTHYSAHLAENLAVHLGITGLWQVSDRSDTSFQKRVAMDVDYVRNRSFLRDLRIVLWTAVTVLRRDGAR